MTMQQATLNSWRITRGRSQQQQNDSINNNNSNNNNDQHIADNFNNNKQQSYKHNDDNSINMTPIPIVVNNTSLRQLHHPSQHNQWRQTGIPSSISSLRQQPILPFNNPRVQDPNASWGHGITPKPHGIFRLGLRNINALPVKRSDIKK